MTIHISHTFLMFAPIIAVFLFFSFISLVTYKDMSSGGGDAGMIGAMLCLAMPVAVTVMFSIPYTFAIVFMRLF